MARRLLLAVFVMTCITFGLMSDTLEAAKKNEKAQVNFTLPDIHGKTVDMEKMRGKVVFVTFFASWCKPCRAEAPHLNRLQAKYKRDLRIFGVGYDEANADKLAATAKDFGIEYDVLVDKNKLLKKSFNVQNLPFGILVDDTGNEIKRYRGVDQKSLKDLEKRIAKNVAIIQNARSGKKIYYMGNFEESSDKAKEAGLGVLTKSKIRSIIQGQVLPLTDTESSATIIIEGSVSKIGPVIGVEIRIKEVRSGELVDSFTQSIMRDDWEPFKKRFLEKLDQIK